MDDCSKNQFEASELTYPQKVFLFFTSPYTSWCYNVVFHIVFLIYFSYFILLRFCIVPGPHEIIILIM